MTVDSSLKFTRVKKGYDPREVDSAFDKLLAEITGLRNHSQALKTTVSQYDDKFRQLAQSTQQLAEERSKESLRVTGLMNAAAQMADQTEQSARQEAEKIIRDAQQRAAELKEAARQEAEEIIKLERQKAGGIKELAFQKAEEIVRVAQLEVDSIKESTRLESARVIENVRLEGERLREKLMSDFLSVKTALRKLDENTQSQRQSNEYYLSGANSQLAELSELLNQALGNIPDAASVNEHFPAAIIDVSALQQRKPNPPPPAPMSFQDKIYDELLTAMNY